MEIIYAPWQGIKKKAQEIQKHDCPHVLSRGGYDLLKKKLLDKKRKRLQEKAMLTENTTVIDNPSSLIEGQVSLSEIPKEARSVEKGLYSPPQSNWTVLILRLSCSSNMDLKVWKTNMVLALDFIGYIQVYLEKASMKET